MKIHKYDHAAQPGYADQVIDALLAESKEVGKVGVDRAHVAGIFKSPNVGCIVAVEGAELLGTIIVSVGPAWYNPKVTMARDLLVWVHPAHRGGSVFVRMVKVLEDWAKTAGVKRLSLSQSTGVDVTKTAGLYEKMGYFLVGFLSVKEI